MDRKFISRPGLGLQLPRCSEGQGDQYPGVLRTWSQYSSWGLCVGSCGHQVPSGCTPSQRLPVNTLRCSKAQLAGRSRLGQEVWLPQTLSVQRLLLLPTAPQATATKADLSLTQVYVHNLNTKTAGAQSPCAGRSALEALHQASAKPSPEDSVEQTPPLLEGTALSTRLDAGTRRPPNSH